MNREVYDNIFKEEVKNAGLQGCGLGWSFAYLGPGRIGEVDTPQKHTYIRYDITRFVPFRRTVRHELYHMIKGGGGSEFMAILCEYFPCILRKRQWARVYD